LGEIQHTIQEKQAMVATTREVRQVGRKPKDYQTKQVRLDMETAGVLHKLAALTGQDLPDYCRAWLLPLAQAEYRKRVDALHREIHDRKK
jgi:hypothetical protein